MEANEIVVTTGTFGEMNREIVTESNNEQIEQPVDTTPAADDIPGETVETNEQVEENVATFSLGGEPQKEEKPEAPKDKYETLKAMGFDDFEIDFLKFREGGNDPYVYLEAKARDWNKVSDLDIVRLDFEQRHSHLDKEDIEFLFNKQVLEKYGVTEYDSDEDKRLKSIQLRAEAQPLRQKRIDEQAKFVVPSKEAPQDNTAANLEAYKSYVLENDATKNFIQSKRVVADLGDGVNFNFQVDNPDVLASMLYDGQSVQKYLVNEKGEPDINKQLLVNLFLTNPNAVLKSILNYGQSLERKKLIDEGQNIVKPERTNTSNTQTPVWREGRLGG